MSKQPFMPLFFGDFLASTAEWSGEERALYLLLLSYQWSMGSLPTDSKRLAKLVDYERRVFDGLWEMVSKKFVDQDGRLFNLRLESHRERSKQIGEIRSNTGRNGGIASGEARRRKAEANASGLLEANAKQTRSNGSDFAEAESNHPIHTIPIQSKNPVAEGAVTTTVPLRARAIPDSPKPAESDAHPYDVAEDAGCDAIALTLWLDHRRACGKPIPPHAQIHTAQILRGMGDAETQRTAVRHAMANNWQSLRVGDGKGSAGGGRPGKPTFEERMAPLRAAAGDPT